MPVANTIFFRFALLHGQKDQFLYWRFDDQDGNLVAPAQILSAGVFDPDGNQIDVGEGDAVTGRWGGQDLTRKIGEDPGPEATSLSPSQLPVVALSDQLSALLAQPPRTGGFGYYFYRLDLSAEGLKESKPDKPYFVRIHWRDPEGIEKVQYIHFHVRKRENLKGRGLNLCRFTPYKYTTPELVLDLLKLKQNRMYAEAVERGEFDRAELVRKIVSFEDDLDFKRKTSWKRKFRQDEVLDFEALRQRYPELFGGAWFAVPRPLHLEYGPLLPLDPARRHRIELFDGVSHIEGKDPMSRWADYFQLRPEGREKGRWSDWQRAILYLRKSFVFRRGSATRVSYEYGKHITCSTRWLYRDDCEFLPVETTWNYQNEGYIRIEDEWIYHNGATPDGFFNLRRGEFNTVPVDHPPGCEVYEIPMEIVQLVTRRVAAEFIETDAFNTFLGDAPNTGVRWADLAKQWKDEWEKETSGVGSWSEM